MGRKSRKRQTENVRFRNGQRSKEEVLAELTGYGISEAEARKIYESGEVNDEFQDRYWLEYTEAIYVRELIDLFIGFDG